MSLPRGGPPDPRVWDGAVLVLAVEGLARLGPDLGGHAAVVLRVLAILAAGLALAWPRAARSPVVPEGAERGAVRRARPGGTVAARLALLGGCAVALVPWSPGWGPAEVARTCLAAGALALGSARAAGAPARGARSLGAAGLFGVLAATRLSPAPLFSPTVVEGLGAAVALLLAARVALGLRGGRVPLEGGRVAAARALRGVPGWAPPAMLAALSGVLIGTFVARAWGGVLFGNDHSTFLYNLHVLRGGFPRLLSYTPWWNGGVVEWEPVRSGSPVALALLAPFLSWASLEQLYLVLIPVLAWGVTPVAVALSARLLGVGVPGAAAAGLLALLPNADVLEWIYRHGVPAFLLSAALVPLATALLYRVAVRGDARWGTALALLATFAVGMFWMLFGLMVLPAALLAVLWPGIPLGRRLRVIALLAAGVAVHVPWIAGFFAVYDPEHLAGWPGELRWTGVLAEAEEGLRLGQLNPVLLVVAFLGARHLGDPAARAFGLGAGLLVLGPALLVRGTVETWDMLQFDRFVIPAGYLLAIPAGAWVEALGRGAVARLSGGRAAAGALAAVAVVLLLHGGSALAQYTRQKIRTLPPPVGHLAERLRALTPPSARILFAGRWGNHPLPFGGQLAYVQILTGRAMIANYYHYPAGPTQEGRIPPEFLASPEAFARYLHLYNVGVVVVRPHESHWLRLLRALPEPRPREEAFGRLRLFQTGRADGLTLDPCARVEVALNLVRVVPCEAGDLVLKLHWVEGLEARGPATIEPHVLGPGRMFIRVRPRAAEPVEIRYRGPPWRAWLWAHLRSPPGADRTVSPPDVGVSPLSSRAP
jgi:hypothetical protein